MLNFKIVESQKLIFSKGPVVAADTTNLEAKFEVNDLFTETLRAYWNVRGSVVDSFKVDLNTSGICTIPSEVLASISDPSMYGDIDHILQVSVVSIGKDDTIRTTSTTCEVPVYKSSYTGNISQPSKPSGDGNVTNIITGAAINGEQMDFYNGNNVIFSTPLANLKNFLLPIAGGNMQGNINMDGNAITGLPNAVNDTDALTLAFAETLFAPSGYGYGEASLNMGTFATESDLETALTTILAGLVSYESKQVNFTLTEYSGYRYHATVYKRTDGNGIVEATTYSSGVSFVKICSSSAWNPLEWATPPMALGVEYRTTERYLSKPVYTMAISGGNMPSSGSTLYKFSNATATALVAYDGKIYGGTGALASVLFGFSQVKSTWCSSDNSHPVIGIEVNADSSAYKVILQVWYVKE